MQSPAHVRQLISGRSGISDSKAQLFPPAAGACGASVGHVTTIITSIRMRALSKGSRVPCIWTKGATVHRPRDSHPPELPGLGTYFVTSHAQHPHKDTTHCPSQSADTSVLELKEMFKAMYQTRSFCLGQNDPRSSVSSAHNEFSVIPACQGLPFIILKSPARPPGRGHHSWVKLSPHRNPTNPLSMFKTHSLE